MDYYDWKAIDTANAVRAVEQGATVWELPISFGNGQAVFTHGLQTRRGTCYVVSGWVMRAVEQAQRALLAAPGLPPATA